MLVKQEASDVVDGNYNLNDAVNDGKISIKIGMTEK